MNQETILLMTPIVIGLTAALKFLVHERLEPLLAIFIGILIAFLFPIEVVNILAYLKETLLNGVVSGLSASGLYAGSKTMFNLKKNKEE